MSIFLYADDDENDVFFLRRALQAAELTNPLQVVQDGRQVIAYLSGEGVYADRQRFPLPFWVFLDLNLPQVRGLELVKWIRQCPELDRVFLVVLTGSELEPELAEVKRLGANECLFKPPQADQLRDLAEAYFRFARQRGFTPELERPPVGR
jgi:CheY-like chemotaxis protein